MSTLSDALAAMDKATPGEWVARISTTETPEVYIKNAEILAGDNGCVRIVATLNSKERLMDNAILLAAAPDMAAWIEKALPLFEDAKIAIDAAYGKGSKLVDVIDALLAEAKGEGKC